MSTIHRSVRPQRRENGCREGRRGLPWARETVPYLRIRGAFTVARVIRPIDQGDPNEGDRELRLLPAGRRLRVDEAGFRLLRERLERANGENPEFAAHRARLLEAVEGILDALRRDFADDIDRVLATGEWANKGIDLRHIGDAEDLVLTVVVNRDRPDHELNTRISSQIVASIGNAYLEEFWLQLRLLPRPLWDQATGFRQRTGQDLDALGIPLLSRA